MKFFKVNFTRTYSDIKIPPRTIDYQIPAKSRDDAMVLLGQTFANRDIDFGYTITINSCVEG